MTYLFEVILAYLGVAVLVGGLVGLTLLRARQVKRALDTAETTHADR